MEQVFFVPIKERVRLNAGSDKETYHLVLGLEDTPIEYQVGDCLGIYPENDSTSVAKVLAHLQASGDQLVQDRRGQWSQLSHFLQKKANLQRLPDHFEGVADFCKKVPPLLPRFYSISSSMHAVGKRAHLTVALVDGICTHYLCKRAELNVASIPVFHHPSRNFTLPPQSGPKPIIMIGPGTGIAPFRAFMQERLHQGSCKQNWLFFGERSSKTDFYYKNFWQELVDAGYLELDCAFSRDSQKKVYVQHKMREKGEQIWRWLADGAYLFVCGDAANMAKEVDRTLHEIVEQEGALSSNEAKLFVKELKNQKRYLRDVY